MHAQEKGARVVRLVVNNKPKRLWKRDGPSAKLIKEFETAVRLRPPDLWMVLYATPNMIRGALDVLLSLRSVRYRKECWTLAQVVAMFEYHFSQRD